MLPVSGLAFVCTGIPLENLHEKHSVHLNLSMLHVFDTYHLNFSKWVAASEHLFFSKLHIQAQQKGSIMEGSSSKGEEYDFLIFPIPKLVGVPGCFTSKVAQV